MRLYLTSAKANEEKMLWLRGWLELQGHRVTSTWFDKSLAVPADLEPPVAMIEIEQSDAVVVFVAPDQQISPNAGFEAGYAYRAGKELFYIGDAPDMFTARYGKKWPKNV